MSETQSLDQRREEAKAAFLATLAAAQRNPNGQEIVEELTRLLGRMEGLGSGGMTAEDLAAGFAAVPDLKDEYGNPIIEINEPAAQSSIMKPTGDSFVVDDVQHLWDMPPGVAAIKKRELDLLWEEAEREEEEYFRRQEYLEAGPSSSKKKAVDRESASNTTSISTASQPGRDSTELSRSDPPKKKKGVSFADGSAPTKPFESTVEWGDVVPATLSGKRRTPIARPTPVMKFGVVERPGKGLEAGKKFVAPDSDDEDEAAEEEEEEDDEDIGAAERDSDEEMGLFEDAESEDEDEEVLALQRQVFSDYQAKKGAIFQRAQEAGLSNPPGMNDRTPGPSKGAQDDEFVPLDATPTNPQGTSKPGASRFRSSLVSQSHSVAVTEMGPDAQETIREGKLVDGQLVAPADSDSDAEGLNEAGKSAIEQLRKRADNEDGDTIIRSQAIPTSEDLSRGKEKGAAPGKAPLPVTRVSVGDVQERTPGTGATSHRDTTPVSRRSSLPKSGQVSETSFPSMSSASFTEFNSSQRPSAPSSSTPTVLESHTSTSAPSSSLNDFVGDRIMAREIVERFPAPRLAGSAGGRVSRFKAGRM
ncbi:hypothetical protein FRB90_000046 [Tulasnella sp. 427]|nr:hypothetical protein FRB90_000046 [Tulasnella sp. 427]